MRARLLEDGADRGGGRSPGGGGGDGGAFPPLQGRWRRRFPPLRGGNDNAATGVGFCMAFVLAFALFFVSFLEPNEYGVTRNYLTGTIGYEAIRGGIHITGPFKGFVKFPAALVTLQYSAVMGSDRPPIPSRTGADPEDPDSGGQPILISCAVQFQFVKEALQNVYFSFGSYEAARQRYLLLAGNVVGNTAQDFVPTDFWTRRDVIADRMLRKINATIWRSGSAVATHFEIMRVDFAKKYEDSITEIQVAEQQKVTNEYLQQVQEVVQSIEVMKSENDAAIANISAGAAAKSKEIVAGARRDAFALTQGMKATKYAELRKRLGLSIQQMQEFFRIQVLQKTTGKVVVGVPGPADVPAAAPPSAAREHQTTTAPPPSGADSGGRRRRHREEDEAFGEEGAAAAKESLAAQPLPSAASVLAAEGRFAAAGISSDL